MWAVFYRGLSGGRLAGEANEERSKQRLSHHLLASVHLLFVLLCFTIMVVLFFTAPALPFA